MNYKVCVFPILTIALACSGSLPAKGMSPPVQNAPSHSTKDELSYAAGTRALNENRWKDAIVSFDQVIDAKAKTADGALYWKAYALNKLFQRQLAQATCTQLRAQFRQSTWNKDCGVLMLSSGVGMPHTDSNEDLKILAMNSLLNRNPAQGIPLLRSMLSGDQSPSIKKHAMFVLAQDESPEAKALMRDLIVGRSGPELQLEAIQTAGIFEGGRENGTLVDLYRSTTILQVKRAVISALYISQDDTRLVDLAKNEQSVELKRAIVSQLSLMQSPAAIRYMNDLLK